jgi:hypothetical protein
MTPHRVLLTLFRHNLAPGEVEHWDAFWEDPAGRYWAGQGPPPEADLPVWKRRSEDRRGNRE